MRPVIVVGMNPGSKRNINLARSTFHARLGDWMSRVDCVPYGFVNIQQTPGKFDPSPDDLYYALTCVRQHDTVIALGNSVYDVLIKHDVESFKLPHPSGLNRKINDREFVARSLDELRAHSVSRNKT